MDSVPVVAITCNVTVPLLGKDSFQEIDIAGITMPITKHNFIVKDVTKLADTIRRAFKIAQTGRPGPVLVDIPKDITAAKTEYTSVKPKPIARITDTISEEDVDIAVSMIKALVSWQGGNMRNAIPRECEVVITIPAEEEADVMEYVQECETLWNEEYHVHETPISFKAERVELPAMMVPDEIRDNLVDAIYACQNGVSRMIPTIPDTVETSSNLAIVTIGGGKAEIKILTRSSRDSMKDYLNTSLESCFSMAGMEVTRTGGYSGWEPNVDSPILKAMKESYKAQFGKEPEVKVIHAGLECGIIGAVVPGLDMISFGPTLRSPHSPDERCYIPSVAKFYDFVVATLGNTPVKE